MVQQNSRKPFQPQTTAIVASPTPGGKGTAQPGRSELRWIKDKGLYSFNRFHSKWYGTKLHTIVDEFAIGRVVTDNLTAKNNLLITAGTKDVFFGRIGDKINIGSQDVSLDIWTGEGWRLWFDEFDMSNLEVDNLVVRNEMWVNSFILNQVRAQNGDEVVSSAGKILSVEVVSTNVFDIIFEVDNAVDAQPFAQYDLILGRTLSVDEVTTLTNVRLTVDAITVDGNAAKITATRVPGTSTPETGDVVARVGNTTTAARMGSVWIIAESNQGPPFIDVRGGIDSWAKHDDPIGSNCVKARLGRLDALTSNTDEFGMWTSNIYLTGSAVGASASYSGTAAERDAFNAANPGVLKEGDRWSVTNENNNLYIWESGAWVDRVDDMIRTDGIGLINKAPAPSGSGLYLGSTYMGFYNGSAWRSYWEVGGDFWLKGASDTCLWWDYSAASLYIGGNSVGSAHLKAVAATAKLEFYDSNNPAVNVMNLDSNIDFDGLGTSTFGGVNLKTKGMVFKTTNTAVSASGVHVRLNNQRTSGLASLTGELSGYVPAAYQSIVNLMSGVKGIAYGDDTTYEVAGIEGAAYVYDGDEPVYGGHFYSEKLSSNTPTGTVYGIRARGINSNTQNTSVYGVNASAIGLAGDSLYALYGAASGGTNNWAGYFQNGNVGIENYLQMAPNADRTTATYGIYFGTSQDTNLYRSAANTLKTDDAFYAVGNITTDGTVDGVDVSALSTAVGLNTTHRSSSGANHTWLNQSLTTSSSVQFDKIYPGNQATDFLDYSAGRFTLSDGLNLSGSLTLTGTVDGRDINSWLGQSVATGASPAFVNLNNTGYVKAGNYFKVGAQTGLTNNYTVAVGHVIEIVGGIIIGIT